MTVNTNKPWAAVKPTEAPIPSYVETPKAGTGECIFMLNEKMTISKLFIVFGRQFTFNDGVLDAAS